MERRPQQGKIPLVADQIPAAGRRRTRSCSTAATRTSTDWGYGDVPHARQIEFFGRTWRF